MNTEDNQLKMAISFNNFFNFNYFCNYGCKRLSPSLYNKIKINKFKLFQKDPG